MILFPVIHRFGGGHAGCVAGCQHQPGRRRDTGRMVDDTARDRAIYHALTAADECCMIGLVCVGRDGSAAYAVKLCASPQR